MSKVFYPCAGEKHNAFYRTRLPTRRNLAQALTFRLHVDVCERLASALARAPTCYVYLLSGGESVRVAAA